eukprot:jgi/Ulvmu1/9566/UM053_0055.1
MARRSTRLRLYSKLCVAIAACIWLSMIAAGARASRHTLDARWQPPETARRDEAATATESSPWLSRTVMQCLGGRLVTRACHFENIYYEVRSKRFVYFGPDGATSLAFGELPKPGEPWLKLVRGVIRWREEAEVGNQFYMDWQPGVPLPAAAEVARYSQPLHLRAPYHPQSMGHLLRDNLQYMIDLPLRFGRDPTEFDWVRWSSQMNWSEWEEETTTAAHYRGLHNNRPSLLWDDVLRQALDGQPKGIRYICFRELIAGTGPADVSTHLGELGVEPSGHKLASLAHYCHPFPFAEMREVAYRNFDMQVAAAPALEPFVLFMDGQKHERRHITNAGDLIPKLQQSFPGVRMEHVEISRLSLSEQLELLSKATVVITNIGSRSFRLIYLPNGATTILIGPPEYEFELEGTAVKPSAQQERVKIPFQEIDWCWGYIGYVNMLQYHVERPEEVVKIAPWTTWKIARNTDVALDEGKLTGLLRIALQPASSGRAHRGSGTLAAYS